MYAYPCLTVNLDSIRNNIHAMVELCHRHGVEPAGVTKLACANPEIAQAMVEGGITLLADSRLINLQRLEGLPVKKMLLRLPALSEVEAVVRFAQVSLNSEENTLRALSKAACQLGITHGVIVMHDLGDLREGCFFEEETLHLARTVTELPGLQLEGIGANLACYGGVEPTTDNQTELTAIASRIEQALDVQINVISGASSAGLFLMLRGGLPKAVNQLRLGASLLMGIGLNDDPIPGTCQSAFSLQCEIIEVKLKPSVPAESTALDAFGNKPVFVDRGIRRRAICAIGKQDIDINQITPHDSGILVIGGSSDHLILDITDASQTYSVGDIIEFDISYSGVLQCMTSEYVAKRCISADNQS
ncbi:ornithine racemase Orr [Kistimonas scapharcae]|uniref:Ornithine racemase Orr n=1 Tax=Kistimonas scapharcae TaxID=1036133 RepID=A0ABP8V6Q3_9GAMM